MVQAGRGTMVKKVGATVAVSCEFALARAAAYA